MINKICERYEKLRSFVPFVQLKTVKITHGGVILLHRCFSRFLNCTNGTKSRKTSNIFNKGI